ncbi:MAG: hypothetical protein ABWJ42_06250 [Sulfolobales archaeon]
MFGSRDANTRFYTDITNAKKLFEKIQSDPSFIIDKYAYSESIESNHIVYKNAIIADNDRVIFSGDILFNMPSYSSARYLFQENDKILMSINILLSRSVRDNSFIIEIRGVVYRETHGREYERIMRVFDVISDRIRSTVSSFDGGKISYIDEEIRESARKI